MSIRINNKIISGTYTSQSYRYVGEIFQSVLPINDSRVALLDGHTIYISEGHGSFIQYLNSLIELYPQLACTEDEWQSCNTTYGECGKFVVTDDSVRLPKIVSFVQGLSSLQDLATLVEAGLPNITGEYVPQIRNGGSQIENGAFKSLVGTANTTSWGSSGSGIPHGFSFDASRSNSIYGNSDTVQPQSIRYPYYIVLATGVTQEVKTKEELTTNNPFTLFESKYSEVDLNNTSWLLSNGQWNSKELYPSAYNELLKEYNAGSNKYSIKLHTEEYGDYDFVLNLDDETFRLPLLDGSEDLPSDNYADITLSTSGSSYTAPANGWYVLEKMASIYGQYVRIESESDSDFKSASFEGNQTLNVRLGVRKNETVKVTHTLAGTTNFFRFIYAQGNGALYYYVGETNINANLVDTGKLTQEVANLIPNNSSLIAGYAMPTDKYIDLTVGASGTDYTAPANGWFCATIRLANANGAVSLTNSNGLRVSSTLGGNQTETLCSVSLPVKRGEITDLTYWEYATGTYESKSLRFIYAEGEQ